LGCSKASKEEKARREEEEKEKEKEKVVVAEREVTDVASTERELVYAGPAFTVAPPDRTPVSSRCLEQK
jgi:hypothetical protein